MRFREEAQQDIDSSSELVEELSRQTDELRQKQTLPTKQGSLAEHMLSLEEQLHRLRDENRSLIEQNDDLQAQLLHESVERGQSLLAGGHRSLADELSGKDSNEVKQMICY